MLRIISFLVLLFTGACSPSVRMPAPATQTVLPILSVRQGDSTLALAIQSLHIQVDVLGNRARTTFDVNFYNPLDRELEGTLSFPLSDGQTICRYALDIEGVLREGVVVEKAKARVAFETTVRQKIDPGLVEKTAGNTFRTRIFPLPARGSRRIVLAVEQLLEESEGGFAYGLPLSAPGPIPDFFLTASIAGSTERPHMDGNELDGFQFTPSAERQTGQVRKRAFQGGGSFRFTLPAPKDASPLLLTETRNGEDYFYLHAPLEEPGLKASRPERVALLWDISGSAEKRNAEKEQAFLQAYFARLGTATVVLVPFHIRPLPAETFIIQNGSAAALLQRLRSFPADGGTSPGSLDLEKYNADAYLLFSDGLATFGDKEWKGAGKPVHAIASSAGADFSALKNVAVQSGGQFLDLSKVQPAEAARFLYEPPALVQAVVTKEGEVEDVVATLSPGNRSLNVTGKLKAHETGISVELGHNSLRPFLRKEYTIRKAALSTPGVARTWAGQMIGALDLQYEENREAITALGKEYSVVTRFTSLLVLDRVADYVQHGITPPAELLAEYKALLRDKQASEKNEQEEAFAQALAAMEDLKAWWHKSYAAPEKGKKGVSFTRPEVVMDEELADGAMDTTNQSGAHARRYSPLPNTGTGTTNHELESQAPPPPQQMAFSDIAQEESKREEAPAEPEGQRAIELEEWKPDAPYLAELEKAPASRRYATYLRLRATYRNQPSFFVDAARVFRGAGAEEEALLVLSNLGELEGESAELLRMMAYELLDMKRFPLAVRTLEDVRAIREEEPQSYRDLALAYGELGADDKAIRQLYHLATGIWDSRFGDVRSIALNEMNALISRRKSPPDLSGIDPRFIYAMPVDVRIVIGWSSDASDIDLWVTDPHKVKCDYQNQETPIGGRMSADVTQGYGPEEFLLKKAVKGGYKVEVNLYGDTRTTLGGPITIKADLFTDFGKKTQKKKTISFRVLSPKEVVPIGNLTFDRS